MSQTTVVQKSPQLFPEIIERLDAGEVIILHTDTTYALLAKAEDEVAVNQIFSIKQGATPQPLALLTRQDQAEKYFVVDSYFKQFLEHFPYPVSLIVQPTENVPPAVVNGFKNIGSPA